MKTLNITIAITLIIFYLAGFLEPSKISVVCYLVAYILATLNSKENN